MRVKRYFVPLIIYMTEVVRREQIYRGGAGGVYTLAEANISWLQYYATSGNIKIFKITKIKMPESGESNADLRPHKNRRPTLQMPV